MMRRLGGVAILGVLCAGCGESAPESGGVAEAPPLSPAMATPAGPTGAVALPVSIATGSAMLTPENTRIEYVGGKPDGSSHTGGFREFDGTIELDPATKAPTSISMLIKTESIYSDNERLTGHLKSPDFFDVRQYPEATFQSTAIAAGDDGYQVTGDLTLHGATNSISFPARIDVAGEALTLHSEFTIDRLAFGMNYQPDGINKDVKLTVVVGERTPRPSLVAASPDGGFGGGRGGPGGGFDPQAIFAQRDADGDGKLTGDEISERMRGRLEEIDADGDGSVTLEEFQASMSRFRPGGGPGGPGGGPGGPGGPGGGQVPSDGASESP